MRYLRDLEKSEMKAAYETVFRDSFPPQELKPLRAIEYMRELGEYRTLGYFEDGEPLGYICLWLNTPYILIDYLCVPREKRNCGAGGETVRAAIAAYPSETIFIGEAEAPTGDEAADGLKLRRLGFYARLGARTAGYDSSAFGVHYKTIYWANGPVDEELLQNAHRELYKRHISPDIYARAVRIPYVPGEELQSFDRWDE